MKERPILFSAPMVRALLNGTKTQTRRVIRDQPMSVLNSAIAPYVGNGKQLMAQLAVAGRKCPYGQPGDRLWVRETWTQACVHPRQGDEVFYRADGEVAPEFEPWIPSIHMFRWASRITLEIVGVRVERLQEISEADAEAEGIETVQVSETDFRYVDYLRRTDRTQSEKEATRGSPVMSYATLWESINGTGSWEANPFVWCVEFKRVQP